MWCRENAGECTGRCPARLRKRLEKKGKWRQRPGEILVRSLFLRGTEDSHCTRRAGQTRRITNYVGPDALVRVGERSSPFPPAFWNAQLAQTCGAALRWTGGAARLYVAA